MPIRSHKNIFGFIDPISIIGVLFLVVTLAIGTVVTTNKDLSLNISEKAALTTAEKLKVEHIVIICVG